MQIIDLASWSGFKSLVLTAKSLHLNYADYTDRYEVFAQDGILLYRYILAKDSGDDVVDFETNYKSSANAIPVTLETFVYIDGANKKLKTYDPSVLAAIQQLSFGSTGAEIVKTAEYAIVGRTEVDVPGVTYTVPSGKNFYLAFFGASLASPTVMNVRLKVDNVTKFRLDLGEAGSAGNGSYPLSALSKIATAGQIVKITVETNISKGTAWVGFTGAIIDAS